MGGAYLGRGAYTVQVASFQQLNTNCTSPCTHPHIFLLAFLETIPAGPNTWPSFPETKKGSRYCTFPVPPPGSSLLAVQSNRESLKQKLYSPVVTLYPTCTEPKNLRLYPVGLMLHEVVSLCGLTSLVPRLRIDKHIAWADTLTIHSLSLHLKYLLTKGLSYGPVWKMECG